MADLFYSTGKTLQEQVDMLKHDILIYARTLGCGKKKLSILFGNKNNINNNILIVQPPFRDKIHFKGNEFKALLYTLAHYEIHNYFITYANPVPMKRHTKDDIKQFNTWMSKIIEIVLPKLIVTLGEEAELVFFRRKFILRDFHGTIVGNHHTIPVMLSFPFTYYASHSAYEDRSYKEFIQKSDWSAIKTEYDRRITSADNI